MKEIVFSDADDDVRKLSLLHEQIIEIRKAGKTPVVTATDLKKKRNYRQQKALYWHASEFADKVMGKDGSEECKSMYCGMFKLEYLSRVEPERHADEIEMIKNLSNTEGVSRRTVLLLADKLIRGGSYNAQSNDIQLSQMTKDLAQRYPDAELHIFRIGEVYEDYKEAS